MWILTFDDDGRQMVLDYVAKKYGKDKVAHICTFGTMATKMAIRDVARVLNCRCLKPTGWPNWCRMHLK
jgi:DNA polymerase III alpha subunit